MAPLAQINALVQERGRNPVRQASPQSARRLSRDNLTPPSSATSVLPPVPGSKHGVATPSLVPEAVWDADGEDVTERALLQLSTMFKEHLPLDVLAALRALFKVDDVDAVAREDALISHGGADGLDQELDSGEVAV
ncbi:hypothetical protein ZWY2020_058327 [Hordeum vulgare]|nr:hypothetical protein ZWY2020_058327 [Hordeum vulgare]